MVRQMDKYEFGIKIEQIKKLMKKKDFITAVKIADTIDWEKVKENQLLIMAADVYEIAGKYDPARDVLLLAYEKTGLGRQLAYRLCRLSVKRGDIAEAEEFYEEFIQNSPRDAGKYILQYEMSKGRGQSIEKQIEILETYIEEDMDDRWAYELAKLYHKAHFRDKCVEICDTIILWFADGKYVEKALELKQLYVPLSENQKLKYEAQKSRKAEVTNDMATQNVVEETTEKAEPVTYENVEHENVKPAYVEKQNGDILDEVHEADIDVNSIHVKDYSENNKYDTVNLQMELAKSVSSLFDNTIEVFKPNVKKVQPVEEENQEDDQIEGQMSLEEVLAMFESGEIQTRKPGEEAEKPEIRKTETEELETTGFEEKVSEEVSEEVSDIEELEDIEDEVYEESEVGGIPEEEFDIEEANDIDEESDIVEEANDIEEEPTIVEEANDIGEESAMVEEEIGIMEENDIEEESPMEEIFEEMPGFDEDTAEEEIVAEILAREIQFDIEEKIKEEIKEEEEDTVAENEATDDLEEAAEDDYSEDAESEVQESKPTMFDLKSEAPDEVEEKEAEENVTEEKDTEEKGAEAKQAYVPRAVVQSDTAKEELKNFIARFSGVQGLDKQILKVMQNTLKVEKEPVKFIFVKGEVKSGKTTLAIEVLKLANKLMQRRDQKIAKIKAESINGKSIDGLLKKLNGSDILIEKVSDMEPDTFVEFIDELKAEAKERFVIFEDEKTLADAFLDNVPDEYRGFANLLDIRQNKIKDWTKMAADYAKKQGYTFDEMSTLALSAKIDRLRAITLVVHKNHVEQLVDGAIKKSEKFSLRKLFGRAKDENGLIVLNEKDFMD